MAGEAAEFERQRHIRPWPPTRFVNVPDRLGAAMTDDERMRIELAELVEGAMLAELARRLAHLRAIVRERPEGPAEARRLRHQLTSCGTWSSANSRRTTRAPVRPTAPSASVPCLRAPSHAQSVEHPLRFPVCFLEIDDLPFREALSSTGRSPQPVLEECWGRSYRDSAGDAPEGSA